MSKTICSTHNKAGSSIVLGVIHMLRDMTILCTHITEQRYFILNCLHNPLHLNHLKYVVNDDILLIHRLMHRYKPRPADTHIFTSFLTVTSTFYFKPLLKHERIVLDSHSTAQYSENVNYILTREKPQLLNNKTLLKLRRYAYDQNLRRQSHGYQLCCT